MRHSQNLRDTQWTSSKCMFTLFKTFLWPLKVWYNYFGFRLHAGVLHCVSQYPLFSRVNETLITLPHGTHTNDIGSTEETHRWSLFHRWATLVILVPQWKGANGLSSTAETHWWPCSHSRDTLMTLFTQQRHANDTRFTEEAHNELIQNVFLPYWRPSGDLRRHDITILDIGYTTMTLVPQQRQANNPSKTIETRQWS